MTFRFDAYLPRIVDAGGALAERAEDAGLESVVPTCPGWTVADLVAHQGMVHRWAAANLRNEEAPYTTESGVLDAVGGVGYRTPDAWR